MNPFAVRAAAAVLVTGVTLGCSDVPFLPQWDATMYTPLAGSKLSGFTAGLPIPPSTSVVTPGLTRSVPMDGVAGQALDQALGLAAPSISFQLQIAKTPTLPVSLADTVYMAADSIGLASSTIATGFAVPASTGQQTDTLTLGASAINLLKALSSSNGTLWVQIRGRAAYNGATTYTVQANDSVYVKVALLIKVPVAGGK